MINRISLNGCRYLVSEQFGDIADYCRKHKINPKWIRHKIRLRGTIWYLRLWGRYKNKRKVNRGKEKEGR